MKEKLWDITRNTLMHQSPHRARSISARIHPGRQKSNSRHHHRHDEQHQPKSVDLQIGSCERIPVAFRAPQTLVNRIVYFLAGMLH